MTTASFHLFPYFNDDIKRNIISFIADAPFEDLPNNYPTSTLTHQINLVSKKFCILSCSDEYWKQAIERQLDREPFLWKTALNRLAGVYTTESSRDLAERAYHKVKNDNHNNNIHTPSGTGIYKQIYQQVCSEYLRFKGPVVVAPGQVHLGRPYGMHLKQPYLCQLFKQWNHTTTLLGGGSSNNNGSNEHRHVNIIADNDDNNAGNNNNNDNPLITHQSNKRPMLIHACQGVEYATPTVLVQLLQHRFRNDGTVDILVYPLAYAWMEKWWTGTTTSSNNQDVWVEAQVLRMTQRVTHDMIRLARQEALQNAMTGLMQTTAITDESDEYLSWPEDSDASYITDDD